VSISHVTTLLERPDAIGIFCGFGVVREPLWVAVTLVNTGIVAVRLEYDADDRLGLPLADDSRVGRHEQAADALRAGELDKSGAGRYRHAAIAGRITLFLGITTRPE
jgi:hypothetical protein